MAFKTLDDLDFAGKRVLVRVDLNVPMADGQITDMTRLTRVLPTITEISQKGGKAILLAHFGRPNGKIVPQMSLATVATALSHLLEKPVQFATDCVGPMAEAAVAAMENGDVAVFENTRFHVQEEQNDRQFAAALAASGDIYVNDAFSAAHRAHASTEGLAHLLPAAAGRAMQGELDALETALGNPKPPVVAIVGGAKISTKLDLMGNLLTKVDALVIGGGMANTFLNAKGVAVGNSLCEFDLAGTARAILDKASADNCEIILPVDAVVANELAAGAANQIYSVDAIPSAGMILDVGPKTIAKICTALDKARTLVWNGPLGAFEIEPFDRATVAIANHAAELTDTGSLRTVAGGGDTVAALNHAGVTDRLDYVSTAGGAFLEWMEGKLLPGVEALKTVPLVPTFC